MLLTFFLYSYSKIRHLCKLFGWPKYWSWSEHMLCTSILIGNTLNEPDKWKNVHPSKHLQSTAFQERVIECCLNGRIYDENCRRQNVSRWITSRKIRVAGPLKDRSTTLGMRTRNKATSNLRFVYCPLYISYVCYFCKLAFWRQEVSWIGDQGFFIANTRNFEGRRMLWYTNHWIHDQIKLCTIQLLKY